MISEACVQIKDVLRNGSTQFSKRLVKISITTSLPMQQRYLLHISAIFSPSQQPCRRNRKVTDGVIHFEVNIYFSRSKLVVHRPIASEPEIERANNNKSFQTQFSPWCRVGFKADDKVSVHSSSAKTCQTGIRRYVGEREASSN